MTGEYDYTIKKLIAKQFRNPSLFIADFNAQLDVSLDRTKGRNLYEIEEMLFADILKYIFNEHFLFENMSCYDENFIHISPDVPYMSLFMWNTESARTSNTLPDERNVIISKDGYLPFSYYALSNIHCKKFLIVYANNNFKIRRNIVNTDIPIVVVKDTNSSSIRNIFELFRDSNAAIKNLSIMDTKLHISKSRYNANMYGKNYALIRAGLKADGVNYINNKQHDYFYKNNVESNVNPAVLESHQGQISMIIEVEYDLMQNEDTNIADMNNYLGDNFWIPFKKNGQYNSLDGFLETQKSTTGNK